MASDSVLERLLNSKVQLLRVFTCQCSHLSVDLPRRVSARSLCSCTVGMAEATELLLIEQPSACVQIFVSPVGLGEVTELDFLASACGCLVVKARARHFTCAVPALLQP